jgi:hypothetical protein
MPKPHTFPTLYEDLKTVSISFLTKHGYLKLNHWQTGTITWSRNGNRTGSISIQVNTQPESPYLELDYKCNEAPINYRVQLVSAPSNLGKGVVWYFICPKTGTRCKKLHFSGLYFCHRSAFGGSCYEKQTYSHQTRTLTKAFEALFGSEKAYDQIYSKHFKKHYKGKPTKRYLMLQKIATKSREISFNPMTLF